MGAIGAKRREIRRETRKEGSDQDRLNESMGFLVFERMYACINVC